MAPGTDSQLRSTCPPLAEAVTQTGEIKAPPSSVDDGGASSSFWSVEPNTRQAATRTSQTPGVIQPLGRTFYPLPSLILFKAEPALNQAICSSVMVWLTMISSLLPPEWLSTIRNG